MAIEKTYFTHSSKANNVSEVIEWLSANAAEYLDSVDNGSSGNSETLAIHTSNGSYVQLRNDNNIDCKIGTTGATKTIQHSYTSWSFIDYAVKTSHGTVLVSEKDYVRIFLTKSNLGTPSVYIMAYEYISGTGKESWNFVAFDMVNSNDFMARYRATHDSTGAAYLDESYYFWAGNKTCNLTAFVPFVFGKTYAPDMFITVFSQYPKTTAIIDVDGTKYFYDGYVALKE